MFSPTWNFELNIILLRSTRPSPEVLWFVVTGCCDVLNWAIFTCLSLVHATGAALASLLPGLPPHSPPSHLDLPLRLPWSHISSQEEEEESSKPNNRSDSPTAAASLLDTGHHWLTRQQACFTSVSLRITLPFLLKITPRPPSLTPVRLKSCSKSLQQMGYDKIRGSRNPAVSNRGCYSAPLLRRRSDCLCGE